MFLDFVQLTALFGLGILGTSLISIWFFKNAHKKFVILLTLVELLLLGAFCYFVLPNKNLSGMLTVNILGAMVNSGLLLVLWQGLLSREKRNITRNWPALLLGASIGAFVLLLGISFVTSFTSVDEVYGTIPVTTEEESEKLASTTETPIALAPATAKRKMLQHFSVIPNSNMFSLDGITAQKVNGEYVYVATVEFNGFFKWLKLKEVPGYFMISATDVNAQPKFVEKAIKYSPNAYFGKDAARKIYAAFPGYASTGTINLELDDDGNPFYVQTLYKEYGVSGKMHYNEFKTAVLNAQTGDVKLYDSTKAPEFIDAPVTSSAADSMNTYFGRYSQGWWNQTSFGSKKDVKIPTENGVYASGRITPLLSKDGDLLYFTDFTSEDNNQDSALGYTLVNARTGKMVYYRDTSIGLMDSDGAISLAEKVYPEKKWDAQMPVLYNVDGVPTWIVSLLDSKGIFKKYVYINAVDNDIVVDGDTAQGTLDSYRLKLATSGSNNENTSDTALTTITGTIERVQVLGTSQATTVNFLVQEQTTVFTINAQNNPYAMFLQAGDTVTFKANVTQGQQIATVQDLSIENITQDDQ
ncbi:DNA-binding protein [Enterococcus nangangensis]|uniref:DNA-binding protein n=1 Tax=Enterococcus nangangensis TaxID=2559926 RepID=UPI0010F48412|nr:DNA-binding protein [Enterococcus nangangensis]